MSVTTPIFRLKVDAGDTGLVDKKGSGGALAGSAAQTVFDRGSGEWAVRVSGGVLSVALPTKALNMAVAGAGLTFAIDLAVAQYNNVDFALLINIGDAVLAANSTGVSGNSPDGVALARQGVNQLNFTEKGTGAYTPPMGLGTTAHTLVYRLSRNSDGYVRADVWLGGSGKQGTSPDYPSGSLSNPYSANIDTLTIVAAPDANGKSTILEIRDLPIFYEPLSDADCRAMADNLRGTVDAAPPADTQAPTLTSPTGAQTGATTGSASVTVSEACTAWCLTVAASASAPDAATIKASGTSQTASAAGVVTFPSRTGLTTGTAYKNYFVAMDGSNNTSTVASSASFTPSATNTPPTFPGNIANIAGTSGTAFAVSTVAAQFADTDALTYSASPSGTAWPSGLTINPTTGVISGSSGMGVAATAGLKVRATDTASQTVDSNAFSVTMSAPAVSGTFVTYKLGNNTGTGTWAAGTAVKWEWRQRAGGIGTASISITNGTATVASDGTVTLTGLPAGAGDALIRATASGGVFWQSGVVS